MLIMHSITKKYTTSIKLILVYYFTGMSLAMTPVTAQDATIGYDILVYGATSSGVIADICLT